MLPLARLTVPLTGLPTLVTLKGSPSTSESLVSSELAAITRGVSSAVVAESLTATGASLAALTVTLTVAVGGAPVAALAGEGEGGGAVFVGVGGEGGFALGLVAGGVGGRGSGAVCGAQGGGVVGEQGARRDHQGRVLGGGGRVVDRDRGVVDGADGDVDRGGGGAAVAVADGVGEGGRAVVVGVRRESDVAAGEGPRAVGRAADAGERQGGVGGVGGDGGQRAGGGHEGCVLGGGGRVVDRDRGVVDGADGDVDRGGGGAAVAVADGVGEGGRAVVVGVRRESDVAAGEAHRAVDRAADA